MLLVGETFFRFMLSPIQVGVGVLLVSPVSAVSWAVVRGGCAGRMHLQLGLLMVNAYPHMADELALIQAAAELYTRDGGRSSSSA